MVNILLDENGNLDVDKDNKYVTMKIYSMSTTELPTTSSTSILLTPPPPRVSDPFNPFVGNFNSV